MRNEEIQRLNTAMIKTLERVLAVRLRLKDILLMRSVCPQNGCRAFFTLVVRITSVDHSLLVFRWCKLHRHRPQQKGESF
jgi:hypothetical protein